MLIRENIDEYMRELKGWLAEEKDTPVERMAEFFSARVDGYEEHMSRFFPAYDMLADALPESTKRLLDIGCGTGLELERVFKRLRSVEVTGVDLSRDMLKRLSEKFPNERIKLICADYFVEKFPGEYFDAVISFETLHHFKANKKLELFKSLHSALKTGGVYIECDYIACCEEEERLLADESERKRRAWGVPDNVFIHLDTPLTVEHETALLIEAGFKSAELADCVSGVAMIRAVK